MYQDISTAQNDRQPTGDGDDARRPIRLYRTSAILFAIAFVCVAFAVWYSQGPITASIEISRTTFSEDQGNALTHPTGGIVAKLLVREGQKVKAGDTLVVLDGGTVVAPTDGAVVGLKVRGAGDIVQPGARVLAIVPMPVLALGT